MAKSRGAEIASVQAFERTLTRSVGYKYLVAQPAAYASDPDRRWPLLLVLHGAGERGDDVRAVARHGPLKVLQGAGKSHSTAEQPKLVEARQLLAENFVVVAPQCPKGAWWDTAALVALLEQLRADHRIDARRIYLTGLSMGGFGSWELALGHPDLFAAVAPICGGGSFAPLYQSNTHKRHDLRRLPVWAFHGARDPTVPLSESQRMIDLLKHFKVGDVQFTVYPEAAHDAWTETYANPELYRWFLRHARS